MSNNNNDRKFYNVYLNNNVCCGKMDSYMARGVTDNLFRYIIGDNVKKGSIRDRKISCLGWWKGHRAIIGPEDYCDDAMIIAELIDGKFYDLITGERFYYNKDNKVLKRLNFSKYGAISKETVVVELKKYDSDSFIRYRDAVEQVKVATFNNYQKHIAELKEEQRKRDSIKNVVDNEFDSFIDSVKRRTRK